MYKSQKELLNKGEAVKLPKNIKISSKDLIAASKCSNQVKRELGQVKNILTEHVKNIAKVSNRRTIVFDYDFIIKSSDDGSENQLFFNPYSIIEQIISYLNLPPNATLNDIKLELKNLKDEEKTKYKIYPKILDLCYHEIPEFVKKGIYVFKNGYSTYGIYDDKKECIIPLIGSEDYIETCKNYSIFFENILSHFTEIKDFFYSKPISFITSNNFRVDEVEFLVAKGYLNCIKSLKDTKDIEKYMIYLNSYFKENKDLLGKNNYYNYRGKSILFDSIYNEYLNVLSNNPDIVFEDEKDNNELDKKEDLSKTAYASWSFLDNDSPFDEKRINRAIYTSVRHIKDDKERELAEKKMKEIFYRKVKLFDSLDYYKKVKGLNRFSGYVAYIFNNGNVILEKFFDLNSNGEEKIAHDEAIYVMNIDEFLELSSISKQEIISNRLCKRINHNGDFENRIMSKINETGVSPEPKYLELVKNGYIKER